MGKVIKKTIYKQFQINEVSNWLTLESEVQLPSVQRGFVWKVSQIERLWDSIFRGYPIGAMMMSHEGDKLMLLDGQQRSTSIALGFYNPWEDEKESIGNASNLPVVWIETKSKEKTDTQEYTFRVVTRSHPWGYQLKENNSILPVFQRSRASDMYTELFQSDVYTKLKPTERLPYDATCPIPLCFLLETVQKEGDAKSLIDKCIKYIPQNYRTLGMKKNEDYYSLLKSIDFSSLFEITREIVLSTEIPAIIIPKELLIDKKDTMSDKSTLFVRINSQGTKIEGEELMYSMFKSVCPQTKELVECLGMNIIPPSRIITIISRLVLSEANYVSGLSLAQFRKHVIEDAFIKKMNEIIGKDDNSPIKQIIDKAIEILKYGGVPNVVVKKFIRNSPNSFLLLIHWLYKNKDTIIDDKKRKEISSRLYRNYWFGNDIEYFIKKNWNLVSQPNFWSDQYFTNEDLIRQYPLIEPKQLLDFLIKRIDNPIENHDISPDKPECEKIWQLWEKSLPRPQNITEEEYHNRIIRAWRHFLYKLLGSRDKSLLLLAQRDYINKTFPDFNQLEDLEDTNTPWDWDHIYPCSWVYNKRNIDERTKRWEWRIGNFRAMSLTDNRSENNNLSPAERFDTPNANYFIQENDLEFWKQLDASHKYIKENDPNCVLIHAKAIITRSVNIYDNFLKMFV